MFTPSWTWRCRGKTRPFTLDDILVFCDSFKEPARLVWTRSKRGRHFNRCAISIHSFGLCIYEEIARGTYKSAWSHAIEDISYCVAEPYRRRLFAWIARSARSNDLECHVVLCKTSQRARALAELLAKTFFESYQARQRGIPSPIADRSSPCSVCETIARQPLNQRSVRTHCNHPSYDEDEIQLQHNNDDYERMSLNGPALCRMLLESYDEKSISSISHRSVDYDATLADEESLRPMEYYRR